MWCNCVDGVGMLLEKYEGSCFIFRYVVLIFVYVVCVRIFWWIIDSGVGKRNRRLF